MTFLFLSRLDNTDQHTTRYSISCRVGAVCFASQVVVFCARSVKTNRTSTALHNKTKKREELGVLQFDSSILVCDNNGRLLLVVGVDVDVGSVAEFSCVAGYSALVRYRTYGTGTVPSVQCTCNYNNRML